MSQTLPLLEVSGSPTERGRAHGETFKELIPRPRRRQL